MKPTSAGRSPPRLRSIGLKNQPGESSGSVLCCLAGVGTPVAEPAAAADLTFTCVSLTFPSALRGSLSTKEAESALVAE